MISGVEDNADSGRPLNDFGDNVNNYIPSSDAWFFQNFNVPFYSANGIEGFSNGFSMFNLLVLFVFILIVVYYFRK